jgi:streptogramin lyase
MRVSENGTGLTQAHFACGCEFPESLDLGPDGSVWFAEVFENRIGRVIPDRTMPYTASAATVQHFDIPRSTDVDQPPLTAPVKTSLPLSVAVDGRNRVWFSQSALSTASYLDPAEAVPGTSSGFTELPRLPDSDFGSPAAPADVMVDRANGFWWTGEYGDQIEQRKPDGSQGLRFRGSVRRGLTEGPVADAQGNLWVVESGLKPGDVVIVDGVAKLMPGGPIKLAATGAGAPAGAAPASGTAKDAAPAKPADKSATKDITKAADQPAQSAQGSTNPPPAAKSAAPKH